MVKKEKFNGEESYKCEPKHRGIDASESSFPDGKVRNAASTIKTEKWRRNAKRSNSELLLQASSQLKMREHCRDYDACDTEIVENSLEHKM